MPLTTLDCLAVSVCGLSLALLYQRRTKGAPLPLPPGPQRWPLIGRDICYARMPGQDIIILNSYEVATELLDHRSAIYSSRPSQVMAGQLVGWENSLGMLPYGERMRKTRKLLYEGMSVRAMTDLYPLQEQEVIKFVQRLLKTPEQLQEHIHQTVGSSLLKLTYGYNVEGVNDHLIVLANNAMTMFSNSATPGTWMVDTFPFLRYLPWSSFKAKAKEWSKLLNDFTHIPMNFVHERLKTGDGEPCLAARWIEREVKEKEKEKELAEYNKSLVEWAGAALVLAGTDTTASAVTTFFALMALHPEVQAKAQAEITRVIGNDRLPTYGDRDSLPYIEAVYKEVLRGMRIPKGSVVFAMIGNMLHNPQMYRDPHVFNPERFIATSENVERNPENIIFGFGRRRCPGTNVAHSSVWLAITFVLATYKITPALGPDGKPVLPKMKFTKGSISHIDPYQCNIIPRSPKAISLIEEATPEMVI
ncbi:cytochrome P450 [Rhizoctonia solani]|nr:cytochrome P450 [Rhizoctonia solani]